MNCTGSTFQTRYLQVCSDSSSVSERTHTTIPVRLLYPGLSGDDTQQHLHSADSTIVLARQKARQAFSVAGMMVWNTVQDFIRDPTTSADCFTCLLKSTCSHNTIASSILQVLNDNALYKINLLTQLTHWTTASCMTIYVYQIHSNPFTLLGIVSNKENFGPRVI